MAYTLISKLPYYIVNEIKLFTGEACWRRGKFIHIHKIPKEDPRYELLLKKPKIRQIRIDRVLNYMNGYTWFKLDNGKFAVISVGIMKEWIEGLGGLERTFWKMEYNQQKILRYV